MAKMNSIPVNSLLKCSVLIQRIPDLDEWAKAKRRTNIANPGGYVPVKTPKPAPVLQNDTGDHASISDLSTEYSDDDEVEINDPNDEILIRRLNNEATEKNNDKIREESKTAWRVTRQYLDDAGDAVAAAEEAGDKGEKKKGSSKPVWPALIQPVKRCTNPDRKPRKELTPSERDPPAIVNMYGEVRGGEKSINVAVRKIGHVKPDPPMTCWAETPFNNLVPDGAFLTNYPYLGGEMDPQFENQLYDLYDEKDYNSSTTPKMPDEVFFDIVNKYMSIVESRRRNPINKSAAKKSPHSVTEPLRSPRNGIVMPVRSIFTAIAAIYPYLGFPFELEERYIQIFHNKDKYNTPPERQVITTVDTMPKAMDDQPCCSKSLDLNYASGSSKSIAKDNTSGSSNSKANNNASGFPKFVAKNEAPGCCNSEAKDNAASCPNSNAQVEAQASKSKSKSDNSVCMNSKVEKGTKPKKKVQPMKCKSIREYFAVKYTEFRKEPNVETDKVVVTSTADKVTHSEKLSPTKSTVIRPNITTAKNTQSSEESNAKKDKAVATSIADNDIQDRKKSTMCKSVRHNFSAIKDTESSEEPKVKKSKRVDGTSNVDEDAQDSEKSKSTKCKSFRGNLNAVNDTQGNEMPSVMKDEQVGGTWKTDKDTQGCKKSTAKSGSSVARNSKIKTTIRIATRNTEGKPLLFFKDEGKGERPFVKTETMEDIASTGDKEPMEGTPNVTGVMKDTPIICNIENIKPMEGISIRAITEVIKPLPGTPIIVKTELMDHLASPFEREIIVDKEISVDVEMEKFEELHDSSIALKSETQEERRMRIKAEATKYYKENDESLAAMSKAFCPRCLLFGCITHEADDRISRNQTNTKLSQFLVDPEFKCPHSHCVRKRPSEPVSVNIKKRGRPGTAQEPWTPDEVFFCSMIYRNCSNMTICWISRCMGTRSCSEVRDFIKERYNIDPMIRERENLGDECYGERVDENAMQDNEAVGKSCKVIEMTQGKKRGSKTGEKIQVDEGAQYKPCNHEPGVKCSPQNCSCAFALTYCERWCGCSLDCERRFRGCRCKNGCDTTKCPCIIAHRECDPTVCTQCKSDVAKYKEGNCKNVAILYRREKPVIVKKSSVAGWGGFIGCDVKKFEYIAEYCGELISLKESERRAFFYNKINHTYLFSLNNTQVIDATRIGSKTRFINSSKQPNCIPKVLMVSGDHRIGIYAKRKLSKGEELFFDYESVIKDARVSNGNRKPSKSQSRNKCVKIPRKATNDNKAHLTTVVSGSDSDDESEDGQKPTSTWRMKALKNKGSTTVKTTAMKNSSDTKNKRGRPVTKGRKKSVGRK